MFSMAASLSSSKMAHAFIFDFWPRSATQPCRLTPLLVGKVGTGAVTLSSVTVTLNPGFVSPWPDNSTDEATPPPPACMLSLTRIGDGRTRKSLRAAMVDCARTGNLSVIQPRVYISTQPNIYITHPLNTQQPENNIIQSVTNTNN